MPKLWTKTIEAHRREVSDAILETTVALVAAHGLRAVTMSQIAEDTGIGRATLYKYYPSVEAILVAWHERQIVAHLKLFGELSHHPGSAFERLEAVLEAFALIAHEYHGTEIAELVHHGAHVDRAHDHLNDLIRGLLIEAVESGEIRDDIPPDELAIYCHHALSAANDLPSKAAVRRLVAVTLTGLRPQNDRVPSDAAGA